MVSEQNAAPGVIGDQRIMSNAVNAGFSGDDAFIAVAIALAESGGDASATHRNTNGTTDAGLWQINSVHAQLIAQYGDPFQPLNNARMAFALYQGRGNKFTDWVTYNNRRYVAFLDRAKKTTPEVASGSGTAPVIETGILPALETITNPETWRRIALFLAGLALLIIIAIRVVGPGVLSSSPLGRAAKLAR